MEEYQEDQLQQKQRSQCLSHGFFVHEEKQSLANFRIAKILRFLLVCWSIREKYSFQNSLRRTMVLILILMQLGRPAGGERGTRLHARQSGGLTCMLSSTCMSGRPAHMCMHTQLNLRKLSCACLCTGAPLACPSCKEATGWQWFMAWGLGTPVLIQTGMAQAFCDA